MSQDSSEVPSCGFGAFKHEHDGLWEDKKTGVEGFEDHLCANLVDLVHALAPHLVQSFISLRSWWDEHQGLPETHVRLVCAKAFCGVATLNGFQMFKYMLYRAIRAEIIIFSNREAPEPQQSRREVEEFNGRAELLWKDSAGFSDRQRSCKRLLGMTVPSLKWVKWPVDDEDLRRFPGWIEKELNAIFRKHYNTWEKRLLFGRTEEEAYQVQDEYALSVAELLGKIDVRYESRVHLCLRKMYGRGAPLPMLSECSVEAMWEVCRDMYYTRQVSLLHEWFEPFSRVSLAGASDWTQCLHRILKPKAGKRTDILVEFYRSLMEWSTLLSRVVLLSVYLGPEAEVASFVREQLITEDEEAAIRGSIQKAAGRNKKLESTYDSYFSRTNLNASDVLSELGMEGFVEVVFDLELGNRVKSLKLGQYSDVHELRRAIEEFVLKWRGGEGGSYVTGSLWWDGIDSSGTPNAQWISTSLARDRDFYTVFGRWLEDSSFLQSWLDGLGESSGLANNRESTKGLVFSLEAASRIMDLAKLHGSVLDMKRRVDFRERPSSFVKECEDLGLFRTRMPRFSQLFFHDFSESEVCGQECQSPDGRLVSRRAAKAYLSSGVRLESKCGLSDIWYLYLDQNAGGLGEDRNPLGVGVKPTLALHPRLGANDVDLLVSKLQWGEAHKGLFPRSSVSKVSPEETCEVGRERVTTVEPAEEEKLEVFAGQGGQSSDVLEVLSDGGEGENYEGRGLSVEERSGTDSILEGDVETMECVPSSVPEEQELRMPSNIQIMASMTGTIRGELPSAVAESPQVEKQERKRGGEEDVLAQLRRPASRRYSLRKQSFNVIEKKRKRNG